MRILRLSHVDIAVPDLDLAAAYYTQVMGMLEVERTPDRVFFKCWDEEDHHSLAVRTDPRVGMDRFSFKVEREDDLDELPAMRASHERVMVLSDPALGTDAGVLEVHSSAGLGEHLLPDEVVALRRALDAC